MSSFQPGDPGLISSIAEPQRPGHHLQKPSRCRRRTCRSWRSSRPCPSASDADDLAVLAADVDDGAGGGVSGKNGRPFAWQVISVMPLPPSADHWRGRSRWPPPAPAPPGRRPACLRAPRPAPPPRSGRRRRRWAGCRSRRWRPSRSRITASVLAEPLSTPGESRSLLHGSRSSSSPRHVRPAFRQRPPPRVRSCSLALAGEVRFNPCHGHRCSEPLEASAYSSP
jgi:hypothetical protein